MKPQSGSFNRFRRLRRSERGSGRSRAMSRTAARRPGWEETRNIDHVRSRDPTPFD